MAIQLRRSHDEFKGDLGHKHWPGNTVTHDNHLFTMNHHSCKWTSNMRRAPPSRQEPAGRQLHLLVASRHVLPGVSGKGIANVETESLRHVAPTLHGGTLYGESKVLDRSKSSSAYDRVVIYVEPIGYKQHGMVRVHLRRKVDSAERKSTISTPPAWERPAHLDGGAGFVARSGFLHQDRHSSPQRVEVRRDRRNAEHADR